VIPTLGVWRLIGILRVVTRRSNTTSNMPGVTRWEIAAVASSSSSSSVICSSSETDCVIHSFIRIKSANEHWAEFVTCIKPVDLQRILRTAYHARTKLRFFVQYFFYRATLYIARSTGRCSVSVCPSVLHADWQSNMLICLMYSYICCKLLYMFTVPLIFFHCIGCWFVVLV